MVAAAERTLPDFSPQNASNLLWCEHLAMTAVLSRHAAHETYVFRCLRSAAAAAITGSKARERAAIMFVSRPRYCLRQAHGLALLESNRAFARLGVKPGKLLAAVAEHACTTMEQWQPQSIANLTW